MKGRGFVLILAVVMGLSGILAGSTEGSAEGLGFSVSKIHLDGEVHFVLPAGIHGETGNVLLVGYRPVGKGGELLACFHADSGRRYDGEPAWTMALDTGTGVIDVGDLNSDGRDDLVVTAGGRVSAFFQKVDGLFPEHPEMLFAVPYNLPFSRDRAFRIPIVQDLNHDGRDDLFLPVMHGFALFFQSDQGRFPEEPSQVLRLDYASGMHERGEIMTIAYTIPIPRKIDFNGDGLLDLVFSEGDIFHFFPFDSASASYGSPVVIGLPVERPTFGLLQAVVDDVDNDGLPDILVMRVYGKKRQTNEIYLFRGRPGLVFPGKEDQLIVREGMGADPVVLDLDGDGAKELVTTTVTFGLGFFIDYFLRSKVGVDVSIYKIVGEIYQAEPVKVKKVFFKTVEEEGEPSAEQGDFNGDGLDDFVLATNPDLVSFYLADPATMLPDEPDNEETAPSYGTMEVSDLNDDGRDDLSIIYKIEKRRGDVTILISGTE